MLRLLAALSGVLVPSGPTTPRSAAGWSRLSAPPPTLPLPSGGRAPLGCYMTSFLGDAPAAVAYAEEGLALARELGDPLSLGRAHYAVGVGLGVLGTTRRAQRCPRGGGVAATDRPG